MRVLGIVWLSALVAAFIVPTPAATAAGIPATPCRVFPANNVWHLDVSRLPVDRENRPWKRATHARITRIHPDFGPPSYGIPYDVVDGSHPDAHVSFTYADESDAGPYPFGADIHVESGSDRHALMIDRDTCTLYELFAARWNDGEPTADSGAIFRLEGAGANRLRPAGWSSVDAAGLPIFPGLLRYDEVERGTIDHALRMTVSCTSNRYVWPARHAAPSGPRSCLPMGARFRLKAGFDPQGFGPRARVVLRALQTYGVIVADNGSDWYVQGTVDPRWTNHLLDQLKRIPAKAFVAVDASACRVRHRSAAFAYGPGCPAP